MRFFIYFFILLLFFFKMVFESKTLILLERYLKSASPEGCFFDDQGPKTIDFAWEVSRKQ